MSLTNIFNEPRRELIEQGFGAAIVMAAIGVEIVIALCLCLLFDGTIHVRTVEFVSVFIVTIFFTIIAVGVFFLMHAIGEGICNALAKHGFDPRPNRRRARAIGRIDRQLRGLPVLDD